VTEVAPGSRGVFPLLKLPLKLDRFSSGFPMKLGGGEGRFPTRTASFGLLNRPIPNPC